MKVVTEILSYERCEVTEYDTIKVVLSSKDDNASLEALLKRGGNVERNFFLRNMFGSSEPTDAEREDIIKKLDAKLVGQKVTVHTYIFDISELYEGKSVCIVTPKDGSEPRKFTSLSYSSVTPMAEKDAKIAIVNAAARRDNYSFE